MSDIREDFEEAAAWILTFTNETGVPCREVFWSLESANEHYLHNTEKRKLSCTVTALYTQLQSAVVDKCKWRSDISGCWTSDCGKEWWFDEGGSDDNGMLFCVKCGRPCEELAPKTNTAL